MPRNVRPHRFGSLLPDPLAVAGPFAEAGREMNDLFDRVFDRPGNGHSRGRRPWLPAARVWEDDQSYHVELELPGVSRDQVDVTFEEGRLMVAATRNRPEGEVRTHHDERMWGQMSRAFALPESVDADSIEARLTDGILAIRLTKRPEVLPRKIEVKTQS